MPRRTDMTHRVVLITGGAGGLGPTLVKRLIADYTCIVTYRAPREWEALQSTLEQTERLHGWQADLTDEAATSRVAQEIRAQHGPLYGLVHLVGGFSGGTVEATTLNDWNTLIAQLLTTTFLALHTFLPQIKEHGTGRIITVGSAAVRTRPAGLAAYNVAKAGVAVLTEALANELKGTRITANTVLPGSLATPAMLEHMRPDQLVPLERVADTIAFLLGDASDSITGASIPITVTGNA